VLAAELKRFVIEEVRTVARDRALMAATWAAWRQPGSLSDGGAKASPSMTAGDDSTAGSARLLAADTMDEMLAVAVGVKEFTAALHNFDQSWDGLSPGQQAGVLRLVVSKVDYDGRAGRIAIRFCPAGIAKLAEDPSLARGTLACRTS